MHDDSAIVLTHMNGTWEALALGEDSESVLKTGHCVLMWLVKSLDWLMTLINKIISQNRVSVMNFLSRYVLTLSGETGSCLATP